MMICCVHVQVVEKYDSTLIGVATRLDEEEQGVSSKKALDALGGSKEEPKGPMMEAYR